MAQNAALQDALDNFHTALVDKLGSRIGPDGGTVNTLSVTTTLDVTGNAHVGGDLTVDGDINGLATD